MTRAKKQQWSYSTGERGRNRVRAFAHPTTGRLFLEFTDHGRRTRVALGHRDPEAAKGKAEEVAAALRRPEAWVAADATLATLFDIYKREVTPLKGVSKQQHDRRAATLLLACLGGHRTPATLNRRDWDRYIEWRRHEGDGRAGRVRKRPVRDRMITYDLKFLQAVLNWATRARDERGALLLAQNPLKRLPWPKEKSPRRPILTDAQYRKLVAVSARVSPLFGLALTLAHETGHRIGAIRLLRWSDVLLDQRKIRWRGEQDKIGLEQEVEASPTALQALREARRDRAAIAEGWVFPSPEDPSQPCSRHLVRDWWQRGEALAGLAHEVGLGWHGLRRKFATDMKHVPLVDLCYLGGWKDPQTVLKCYQRPDERTMRQALASRGRRAVGGE
jgi:integrase